MKPAIILTACAMLQCLHSSAFAQIRSELQGDAISLRGLDLGQLLRLCSSSDASVRASSYEEISAQLKHKLKNSEENSVPENYFKSLLGLYAVETGTIKILCGAAMILAATGKEEFSAAEDAILLTMNSVDTLSALHYALIIKDLYWLQGKPPPKSALSVIEKFISDRKPDQKLSWLMVQIQCMGRDALALQNCLSSLHENADSDEKSEINAAIRSLKQNIGPKDRKHMALANPPS